MSPGRRRARAGEDITLQSAQERSRTEAYDKSSGASLGATVGVALTGGVSASASAGVSSSKGQSWSQSEIQRNTRPVAGSTLTAESGRDTILRGAVAEGRDVDMMVGRDLVVESRQDTSSGGNSSRGINAGASLSATPSQAGNIADTAYATKWGASVGLSGSTGKSESAIVSEQSAIIARGGTLNADVEGATRVNIAFLRSLAEGLDRRLYGIWPETNRRERAMFQKLKDAYTKARYSKHYRISGEELAWLGERVEELGRVVHQICSERIDELKKAAR